MKLGVDQTTLLPPSSRLADLLVLLIKVSLIWCRIVALTPIEGGNTRSRFISDLEVLNYNGIQARFSIPMHVGVDFRDASTV